MCELHSQGRIPPFFYSTFRRRQTGAEFPDKRVVNSLAKPRGCMRLPNTFAPIKRVSNFRPLSSFQLLPFVSNSLYLRSIPLIPFQSIHSSSPRSLLDLSPPTPSPSTRALCLSFYPEGPSTPCFCHLSVPTPRPASAIEARSKRANLATAAHPPKDCVKGASRIVHLSGNGAKDDPYRSSPSYCDL